VLVPFQRTGEEESKGRIVFHNQEFHGGYLVRLRVELIR
jgi:hypothetical protein